MHSKKYGIYLLVYCLTSLFAGSGLTESEYVRSIRIRAERGETDAQSMLGTMYYNGHGVPRDYEIALEWFLKAASEEHAGALYSIGNMHYNGHGVDRNHSEAIKWYLRAAGQGHVLAQYNLGQMYYRGEGTLRNLKEAYRWFSEAANKGNTFAQYNLGVMYCYGTGVQQNFTRAYVWFSIAALNGDEEALAARNYLAEEMHPGQISDARRLIREWMEKDDEK